MLILSLCFYLHSPFEMFTCCHFVNVDSEAQVNDCRNVLDLEYWSRCSKPTRPDNRRKFLGRQLAVGHGSGAINYNVSGRENHCHSVGIINGQLQIGIVLRRYISKVLSMPSNCLQAQTNANPNRSHDRPLIKYCESRSIAIKHSIIFYQCYSYKIRGLTFCGTTEGSLSQGRATV